MPDATCTDSSREASLPNWQLAHIPAPLTTRISGPEELELAHANTQCSHPERTGDTLQTVAPFAGQCCTPSAHVESKACSPNDPRGGCSGDHLAAEKYAAP